mgnify:CR=1 FL=1
MQIELIDCTVVLGNLLDKEGMAQGKGWYPLAGEPLPDFTRTDIVENGIPTLDFVASGKLGSHFGINFKARNLLNSARQLTRKGNATGEEVVLSKYRKGIDLSLGLTYSF